MKARTAVSLCLQIQNKKNNSLYRWEHTQLSSDMVFGAALGHNDTAILVSNGGDFQSTVVNTKKLGKRVELLFFEGYVSGALRGNCDLIRKARKSNFVPIKFE